MIRVILKSEICGATVTQAYLYPLGTLVIDSLLLEAADIRPGELVSILDATNGARFQSHVVRGAPNSGIFGFNGADAHLVRVGDIVTIASFASVSDAEALTFQPQFVHVDALNNVIGSSSGMPELPLGLRQAS